jgi:hypothetical protein
MTTKIIGIKEYRQNITSLWKEAREKNIRYIVMYHTKPIFEVNPLQDEEFIMESLQKDVKKARKQVKNGEVISHEALMEEFGIK